MSGAYPIVARRTGAGQTIKHWRITLSQSNKKRHTSHRPQSSPEHRSQSRGRRPRPKSGAGGDTYWLYGKHPSIAALKNPVRRIERACVTDIFAEANQEVLEQAERNGINVVRSAPPELDRLLGRDAVHQGVALAVHPLENLDVAELRALDDSSTVVVLDQANDPRNVGAVIRAAAAFGASAVVTTERAAPDESGLLVKAAAGTFEYVTYLKCPNLARAIDTLKSNGFWTCGLSGEAETELHDAPFDRPTALIIGSEGNGLRRLTIERCDSIVRIPMTQQVESLNLASAASIALYERCRGMAK